MAHRSAQERADAAVARVRVRFGPFDLDEANARLLRNGTPVALAPTPLAVLCALARHPGSLATKSALLDEVWGHQFVSESVLKTVISELRTVLDDDAREPRFIETVSRRGYRFIAPTTPVAPPQPVPGEVADRPAPGSPPFIGRGEALGRLQRAWDRACQGKRTIVWVAGEPGIGKTMLVEHFVASLGDALVARGQCIEHHGAGEPYLPVLEALAELCRQDDSLPQLLRAVAPTWLLQLPWLCTAAERDALRHELAGVSPDRMLREMGELMQRSGDRRPLLVVTEDLHWSDGGTIHLLDYIARRRGGGRFMWLATFRLAEVVALDHPFNRLRHELRLHDLCDEIVLDSFSEAEVAEYVAKYAPSFAGDEAFVHTLHERTDGVPLFVASVMNEIGAHAADATQSVDVRAELANLAVPENLAAIIDRYIARLGSEQRELLSAAAIGGDTLRPATIAEVIGREATWVAQACEELSRKPVWLVQRAVPAGKGTEPVYSFRHALFRQVLYERTPAATRALLHRKVALALEAERAAGEAIAANELAMHYERGRELLAALRCYVEAAEEMLAHFNPGECMALTDRALQVLERAPPGSERTVLEISLTTLRGVAASQALGMGAEAKEAFQRACALLPEAPSHRMTRRLLHAFGFVLALRAEYDEALAVADRAEALAAASGDPVLLLAACIAHGEVDWLQGRPDVATTWIERGLDVLGGLDVCADEMLAADPEVTLLGLLGMQLLHLGNVQQARQRLQQAHARAQRIQQPMARMVAIWFDALAEVRLGNVARVGSLADEMRTLVDEFGLAQGRAACGWFRGWADARGSQPREGYRAIREAYEASTRLGMRAGGTEVLGYAVEALMLAGDYDAAAAELDTALAASHAQAERVYLPQLLALQGRIAAARDRRPEAEAAFRRALAEAQGQAAPWLALAGATALVEHGLAKPGDRRVLAALVAQLEEARDTPAVAHARALLARKHAG